MAEDESSLDRFPVRRAAILAGLGEVACARVNFALGGGLAGLSVVLGLTAVAAGQPDLWAGAPGLLAGAAANVAVGVATIRVTEGEPGSEARLSPETRRLRWRYGWRCAWATKGVRRRRSIQSLLSPALQPPSEGLGARHGRGHGFAAALHDRRGAEAAPWRTGSVRVTAGSMAEPLHAAALFEAYPESGSPPLAGVRRPADRLRELGDALEAPVVPELRGGPGVASTSPSDACLEELRLDLLARSELAGDPDGEHKEQTT
ncbi:MAG: hypothetical protein N2109_10990 [Fimbriimonadales bacterium]|nr:hypothetical protein [Fimbriimonadales bacterium]